MSTPKGAADSRAYFRAIEDCFIAQRGAPLLLSPIDWQVARAWREQGIPLEVVQEAIADLFERRRAQGKDDKLRDLRAFRRGVAAAWKRRLDLEAPSAAAGIPVIDVVSRLAALAAALPDGLEEERERIRSLDGAAEEVESRLATLDREILTSVEKGFTASDRAAFEAELEAAVGNLARRLPAAELALAVARLREKLVRERADLPKLSLFAPEATMP